MSKSVKHVNPYREGSNYHVGFAFMQRKQVFTRSEVAGVILKSGLTDKADKKDLEGAATQSATVLLSPRQKNGRGDCRGNLSARGEVYFVQPLNKIKGEEKRFRLRWRTKALARRDYERPSVAASKKEVKQEKTPAKAPAKTAEKVTA
jgi:hypothetical protein